MLGGRAAAGPALADECAKWCGRGKSRRGKDVVRQTTAASRFARSLVAVKDWCRTNRHRPLREQRVWLSAALNGHYAYYGIRAIAESW